MKVSTKTSRIMLWLDTGDDDDIGTGDGTGDVTTEEEGVGDSTDVKNSEESYLTTKAMGDTDREVHSRSHLHRKQFILAL